MRTGRKWRADKAVRVAESKLQHKDIMVKVAQGRQGLGYVTRSSWRLASVDDRRSLVQKDEYQEEEDGIQAKGVTMLNQGSWLHWEGARSRELNCSDIWRMEGHLSSI